jgi:signal transduction histidine kinase/energy-coupling factor transporter ATP-binding protein EcfA2
MNNYSKFTTNYIGKVINTILEDKKSVFLIGPNGMGKSTILKGAMDNLKDHPDYKCLHFDMRADAKEGALDFYTRIIEKIDSTIPHELTNRGLSSIFYEEFSNRVQNNNEQLIIFFDHVESVNRNFYDHFSIVFRRIIIEIRGQYAPLFVFCGSRVTTSPESSNLDTSPLWNVTEPIEVKPCRGKDLEKMISYHYKALTASDADKDSISFIARITNGQTLLIRSLIRYISEKNITCFENDTEIVNNYIVHYLSEQQNDNRLRDHIQHVIDKFTTMPLLLINIIKAIRNNADSSEKLPDRYDNTTISGILTIDSQNNYCFSNAIYKSIFTKLLSREQYFLGDYCLYHYDNDYLWKTAKDSFIPYDKRETFWENIAPANINDLYPRIRQKLRHYQLSAELAHNFCEIIKKFFDINTFGIFTIKEAEEEGKERNFVINQPENQFRRGGSECIVETLQNEITELVHQSVSNKLHMIDWTDSILIVPFTIHDDHKWVFIGLVDGISKDIYNSISDIVSEMFASYYSLLKREKADTYKMLRDQFTISVDDPGRGIMQNLWEEAVPNLQRAGLQKFDFFQFNPKKNMVIVTNSENPMLSNEWQPASDSVIRAAKFFIIYQRTIEFFDQNANKFYLGKQLDNGLVIMFGYSQDNCQQDRIYELKSVYDMFFYVINKMSNSRRLLVRYKRMLYETTDDYIYFVDDQYHIIDSNKYFDDDFPKESDWQTQIKCYKQLMNSENPCSDCQVQNVIQTNEKANILRVIPDRTDKLDCTFTPIRSAVENQIIAVGIRMHPLGIHQTIVEEMPKLEKIDNVDLLEKKIMEILLKFGFKRVYLYKHESEQPGSYISNDAIGDDLTVEKITNFSRGEIGFFLDDPKTGEGQTFVWHRNNLDEKIKSVIEKRLKGSMYELRETVDRMNYANKTLPKDSNYWISIPLLYDGIVEKLIILDNNNDIELDKKLIRLDLLQVLDTFARNAEQIRSNLKHRDYLRTLFRMLSHGTKEPLGMLRNSLFLMFQSTDENVKKEWYKTANAALGFTQSCLGSKLTLERGSGSVSKKPVSITDLLTEQTSFFKAYATHAANIDFQLCIEGDFLYNTDEMIFLQIINNLVSNSLRHLQKLKYQKEKWIKIEVLEQESGRPSIYISDNGTGLPVEVRHFFENPVHQQKNQLTGSFGLYDSQEMAKMLGGQLIYHTVDKGTKFEIQL